jgi:hypothetical protein
LPRGAATTPSADLSRGENGAMTKLFGVERQSDSAFTVTMPRRAVLQAGAATAIAATALAPVG